MSLTYSPSKGIQVTEYIMGKYADRGDPAVPDFTEADLIMDGAWHELDLSGIVAAAGANHLVHIRSWEDVMPNIREVGNVNDLNIGAEWVMMNADRKIEYKNFGGNFTKLVVRGWVED